MRGFEIDTFFGNKLAPVEISTVSAAGTFKLIYNTTGDDVGVIIDLIEEGL